MVDYLIFMQSKEEKIGNGFIILGKLVGILNTDYV